jgi:hypothetical protein
MLRTLGERTVNIGINPNIPPDKRHGIAHVITSKGVEQLPFTVDKPNFLDRLNQPTARRLFKQLENMGFKATNLEIYGPSGATLYFSNPKQFSGDGMVPA